MVKFYGYKNNHMEENMEDRKYVISLYDYTGEALRPWAEAGYHCFAYDIQLTKHHTMTLIVSIMNSLTVEAEFHIVMLTCTTSERLTKSLTTSKLSGVIMAQTIGYTLLWRSLSALTWLYQVQHTLPRNVT